jgi:hypothetical protein
MQWRNPASFGRSSLSLSASGDKCNPLEGQPFIGENPEGENPEKAGNVKTLENDTWFLGAMMSSSRQPTRSRKQTNSGS